ncbi:MAG: heat shock protein HspQ [Methylococcales bacterium]|jgi:heat shock protein HspQ|nr:heat shock protein HspQ [Methylococcales bacterium]MBT7445538.1 heat shock protein HspQ [Methylococcales bacterium]
MPKQPMFYIGQIVHHLKYDYRGVIFDIHPEYQNTDAWYENVAKSKPPKDRPWYHLLVHDAYHATYVSEVHLEPCLLQTDIVHPDLNKYFGVFDGGRYLLKQRLS